MREGAGARVSNSRRRALLSPIFWISYAVTAGGGGEEGTGFGGRRSAGGATGFRLRGACVETSRVLHCPEAVARFRGWKPL